MLRADVQLQDLASNVDALTVSPVWCSKELCQAKHSKRLPRESDAGSSIPTPNPECPHSLVAVVASNAHGTKNSRQDRPVRLAYSSGLLPWELVGILAMWVDIGQRNIGVGVCMSFL